jgi:hypothetical protein
MMSLHHGLSLLAELNKIVFLEIREGAESDPQPISVFMFVQFSK